MNTRSDCSRYRKKVVDFLNDIGIPTMLVSETNGSVPKVSIVYGCIDFEEDCNIADLLHEAARIAITPSRWRPLLNGDIKDAHKQILLDIEAMGLHPDDPICRAAIQSGDAEATAWALAVGQFLKLPAYIINGRN